MKPTILNPICERNVPLMRLEGVGAEVQNVFRVLDIVQVPIALPQVSQVGRTPVAAAKAAMGELGFGAKGVEESFQCIFGTLAALVKRKIFWVSRLANRF